MTVATSESLTVPALGVLQWVGSMPAHCGKTVPLNQWSVHFAHFNLTPLTSIFSQATALAMSSKLSMARSIFRGQHWFEFLFQVPYDLARVTSERDSNDPAIFSVFFEFHTIVITTEVDIHDGHILAAKAILHVGQLGKVCQANLFSPYLQHPLPFVWRFRA